MTNLTGRRILVVDDEPFMRKTIKAILRMVGQFVIEEAGDGEGALVKVTAFKPDCVLCDVGMAPMSGIDFVEKLRNGRDEALRVTPVVMLTADAGEATILDAARLRVSGYLVKPVSAKQLGARLELVFRGRRAA